MNRLWFMVAVVAALGGGISCAGLSMTGCTAAAAVPGSSCDGNYGTSVHFLNSPSAAALGARKEEKLVFVLHVSGQFEDPQFT
jgi:hypothetical protein